MSGIRPSYGGDERMLEDFEVERFAAKTPETARQAILDYEAFRRKQLLRGIEHANSFEVDELRNRYKAWEEILTTFGISRSGKTTDLRRQSKKLGKKVVKEPETSHLAHLYAVLTPPNWRENILKPLNLHMDLCRERILKNEDSDLGRAGLKESSLMANYLANTERVGGTASIIDKERKGTNG